MKTKAGCRDRRNRVVGPLVAMVFVAIANPVHGRMPGPFPIPGDKAAPVAEGQPAEPPASGQHASLAAVPDPAPRVDTVGYQPAPASRETRPLGVYDAPTTESASAGSSSPDSATGSAASSPSWLGQTSMALVAVLTVIGLCAVLFRALARPGGGIGRAFASGGPSPAGLLEILGRYPVGRGCTLVLLKLDRRVLLLCQSPGGRLGGAGMTTLSELTDPEDVASILMKVRDADGESISERFRSMLSAFEASHENRVPEPGRRVTVGDGGDRAELWSDFAPSPAASASRANAHAPEHRAPGPARRAAGGYA